LQGDIHDQFKAYVGARRGSRIDISSEELFSGAFWTGARAVELGLADGLGDVRSILREKYGEDVRMVSIDAKKSMVRSLLGRTSIASSTGEALSALPEQAITALEERAIWARFGL